MEKKTFAIWGLAFLNILLAAIRFTVSLTETGSAPQINPEIAGYVITTMALSVLGAVVVIRTGGNRVGRLMLVLGFALADPFRTFIEFKQAGPGQELTAFLNFAFWTQGWFYFVILYAIFLILLHFPDGQPPSPRWNWIRIVSITALVQYIAVYTFQPKFGDGNLLVDNPIAMLDLRADETISGVVFGLGMILLAVSSLVSIFIRYGQSGIRVRAQIKWLLFSGTLSFSGIGYRLAVYDTGVSDWTDYLLVISLLIMTSSITLAILRYRLYDIDFIIRRTLQYTLLTGLLAFLFFGGVVLLQNVFRSVTGGEDSTLVTVISTLFIAALFNPLRIRTQHWIDRRFYRSKYNAEKALAEFSGTIRNEVDMDSLSGKLLSVVSETMQPASLQLYLNNSEKRR